VLNIKLVEQLREEESGVYGVGARFSYTKYPENRYTCSISFGCAPENVEKLTNSAFNEIKKLCETGPTQLDVDKVKAEDLRSIEVQLKENGFWLQYLVGQYMNNEKLEQILSLQEDLKKITPETLKIAANKYLSGENTIRLVLNPDKK